MYFSSEGCTSPCACYNTHIYLVYGIYAYYESMWEINEISADIPTD